jgi:hypothetical protein
LNYKIHTEGGGVEVDGGGALQGRGWRWLAPRKGMMVASSEEEYGSGGSTTVLGLEEEDGGGLVRGLGRGGGVLQHWG